ncbi:MAG: hypothetical protein WC810_14655 [Janthinobacterium sp.]
MLNGSRLADVIEKELKAKKLLNMNNEQKIIEILQQLTTAVHQLRKGTYYTCDINAGEIVDKQLEAASMTVADLLLDSENDKIGKNDADNIGKPV